MKIEHCQELFLICIFRDLECWFKIGDIGVFVLRSQAVIIRSIDNCSLRIVD